MKIYVCPEHPDKPYSSWRKFRGHWSTRHKGEECPPREEFAQEVEKEEYREERKEYKEKLTAEAEVREVEGKADPREIPRIPGGELPEDPVEKLATILDIHGVDAVTRNQILGIFQIHPGFKDNPANLFQLLQSNLPRKKHASIPLIISAFTASEMAYPEGGGMNMMFPGGGMNPMMPFFGGMGGGMIPPMYPPAYGYYPPQRVPPRGGPEEEEGSRGRRAPANPINDAVALLGTIMELQERMGGKSGPKEGEPTVQEIFEGFRETINEVTSKSQDQQDKLIAQMERMDEGHREALEGIKESLHQSEKDRLTDQINALRDAKDEERTDGLGTLIREAGEGLAAQAEGIRIGLEGAGNKISNLAEKIVPRSLPGEGPLKRGGSPPSGSRSIAEAGELLEAEQAVEAIAQQLETGG